MTAHGLRLPDFVIGGAPRSGTTWLYHLLDRHPQVHLAAPVAPEPKFFLVDGEYAKGLGYYSSRWFHDVPHELRAGEKSTNYLESAVAAARIAADLPDVRMVFMLREPADRALSNHRWSTMNGLERHDLDTAIDLEVSREASYPQHLRFARPHAYVSRGRYAELLRPYVDRLGLDRILCLRFEDVRDRAAEMAGRLHAFLGVEPRSGDAVGLAPVNASDPGPSPSARTVARLRELYSEPNRELGELLGPDFRTWGEC